MKNKLKIAGFIAAVMLLCMSFASCENQNDRIADISVNDVKEVTAVHVTETQGDSNDTSDTITQPSYEIYDEPETEPTYYHVGLEGAVVTEQDGTGDYAFVYKCESCGKTQPGTHHHFALGGTYHGSFMCNFCREVQQFQVITEKN